MHEFSAKKLVVNNYLINYYSSSINNSQINVVFIHGWLSNSKVWFHLMHALSKIGISSYALDLPGFGESQIPTNSVDNDFFVKTVEDFVAKLNLNNIVLVGHSNGGAIAVKYAIKNKILKLVLIDAAGIRKNTLSKKLKRTTAKIVSPIFKLPFLSGLRKKIYVAMGSEDYINSAYLSKTYENVINEDLSLVYKDVTVDTLIIWGKDDTSTPLSFGEFINDNITNSELKIVEGGHFPFFDKPDQVINYLVNFIK